MKTFLALQHTYEGIEIGLFSNGTLIDIVKDNKKQASKTIINLIDHLLVKNKCNLDTLDFFVCNQGPGPFTTLRVVIATLNGINFSLKKPIIPVNGLESLLLEKNNTDQITVALLNAYANDAYFAIQDNNSKKSEIGYKNITNLLEKLQQKYPHENICFIGQGAQLYKEIINNKGKNFSIDDNYINCSLKSIGKSGLEAYNNKTIKPVTQLQPLYLKKWK